ncbi:MAG: DUF1292 domain-containing protein [Epulopiscium sp.]|nr:DUF1292 domain-containing protein [Candidatus Epulonipiscium sp.]
MSKHNDCGCNHEEEMVIKVLFDGEDEEVPCDVLGIFQVGQKEYIAIVPQDSDDQVLLYGFEEVGEEGINLTEIETDEEYEKVAEEFQSLYFDQE